MFEKEAEYYAFDEVKHKQEWYIKHPEHSIDCDYEDIKKHWQKGAEFGYNKANEWHNLQENPADLPLESEFLKDEPDNHRYEWFVVATVGKSHRALYSFSKKKWFIDYEEMMIGTSYFEPIAWCEFPEFEK